MIAGCLPNYSVEIGTVVMSLQNKGSFRKGDMIKIEKDSLEFFRRTVDGRCFEVVK